MRSLATRAAIRRTAHASKILLRFGILLGRVSLAACARQPVLNAEPVRITQAERYEYWLPMRARIDFDLEAVPQETLANGGSATVEYLIDSNGRVSRIRVLTSRSDDIWGKLAVRYVQAHAFEPAPTNPARIPAIVTQQVVFAASPD